jgi:hypothetical protein
VDHLAPDPDGAALRAFVDAVVQHLSFASGETDGAARLPLRRRVVALVEAAAEGKAAEDAARALAADAALLASFFQNVDLLYEGAGYAHADAVAAAVMRAVEMLDARGS